MQIKVRIPRSSRIRQIIRDTYIELYRKFKEKNPKDKGYTREKLAQNIRNASCINGKMLSEYDVVNPSFDAWVTAGYKQVYHFHWYFAVAYSHSPVREICGILDEEIFIWYIGIE